MKKRDYEFLIALAQWIVRQLKPSVSTMALESDPPPKPPEETLPKP